MDADNSFYVKFIATEAPTFFWVYYFSFSHGELTSLLLPGNSGEMWRRMMHYCCNSIREPINQRNERQKTLQNVHYK